MHQAIPGGQMSYDCGKCDTYFSRMADFHQYRDVTLLEILLNAKNVEKTSDITHYLFGIRSFTLERNHLNVKSVGKA